MHFMWKIGPKTNLGELGEKKKQTKKQNRNSSSLPSSPKALYSVGQVTFQPTSESQHIKYTNVSEAIIQKGMDGSISKA